MNNDKAMETTKKILLSEPMCYYRLPSLEPVFKVSF